MEKERFLRYIHHFRGLAIILIVAVHCRTALHWPDDSAINKFLTHFLDSSTILFVFIAGFLFQYLNANSFQFQEYIFKKAKHVIVPYVLISIPAVVDKLFFETDAYWMTPFYKSLSMPFQAVYLLATGKHSGPFYFIPMIAVIYCLAPLLFRFQKTKLFAWAGGLIALLGLFTYAYGYYGNIGESLLYFLPVYVFGMWASYHKDKLITMNNTILISLTLFYLIVLSLEVSQLIHPQHLNFFEDKPHYFTTIFNLSKLKEITLAIILLVGFYRLQEKKIEWLTVLGNLSFGIYFVHIYFINATERIMDFLNLSRLQNGVGYLVFTAGIIALSVTAVWLVKKLFKNRSRLLIGS